MSLKELKKRTSKSHYKGIKFLSPDSREVKKLSKDDLLVLMHLTRAAEQLNTVHLKLENAHNMEFLQFLNEESEKGNEKAILARKMFLSQKSAFSPDTLGVQTSLTTDFQKTPGLGYFPEDLAPQKFHEILFEMLKKGKKKEVQRILNQRTIVRYDGDELKAIDFTEEFKEEFKIVCDELEKAKTHSKDKSFNKYLEYQIQALQAENPRLDARADKQWAKLSRSKFEFTITRECYDETLTKTIYENAELMKKLSEAGVTVYAKDSLGARVGIVNKRGTRLLKKLKNLVYISAKHMPYSNEYSQEIADERQNKQTAVDVDLITLAGDEGAYRASIVLAQNLPNDDKLSLALGGGRRNVYHRQVRLSGNKKVYKNLICDEQFSFYDADADHWAVICHENTHSLGPKSHNKLGKYSAILEEYKADMGMYAFLDEFVDAGEFKEVDAKKIMTTSLSHSFLKGKPNLTQAHRTRSVMICNRMLTEKAIMLKDEKLVFDYEKIKSLTKKMLAEVIRLQIDADVKKAEDYVIKWFVWTDEINKVAEILKKHSKTLNGYLIEPLKEAFLKLDYEKTL